MRVEQRFREVYNKISSGISASPDAAVQAAAMLILAEAIQETTHTVDVNLTNDARKPFYVTQR